MNQTQTITPDRLAHALDGRRGIKILSLDCFDTLLWRDTHASHDLFDLLEGVTKTQRVRAERKVRKQRQLARMPSAEVTIREIYARLMPGAGDAVQETAVRRELEAEMRHCYAFAPAVALIREAKRRGMRVVVVSDTYFEQHQLRALIRAAAGDDLATMIDAIFCSCDARTSKSEQLFGTVLDRVRVPAARILHIGDNHQADAIGASRYGINALHLIQFSDDTLQRLRHEAAAGALMMPGEVRFQPHRATLAVGEPTLVEPAAKMGFSALGPILAAFARWTAVEAAALAVSRGGPVHLLFLMRDGYLPREVFSAIFPQTKTHAIEISRFAATAASLTDAAAVAEFILEEIGAGAGVDLLRQLHIVGDEATALLASLPACGREQALADALTSQRWTEIIVARSLAYADRFAAYVRKVANPAPGDTLMLVDLGYNGSVQNMVEAQLSATFGVHVAGRYLALCEQDPSGFDKRGMIDRRDHDEGTMAALLRSIAILEQFCTVNQGSVVDYDDDAAPVRAALGIKGRQSDIRSAVQAGCLTFARADGTTMVRRRDGAGGRTRRHSALAALTRLLFLPSPSEIALMSRFEHDANLGSDETTILFDPALAASGLRERGLFYMKNSRRLFLPAELRGQGLPASLTLLAQRRFGLDLCFADFADHALPVPVLVADGTDSFADTVEAIPTHQGNYVAAVPIGAGRYTLGIQFGRDFELVQIESAQFLPVSAFLDGETAAHCTVDAMLSFEDMEQIAPAVFRCTSNAAFMMAPPPAAVDPTVPMLLAVAFRPLVAREREAVASDPSHHEADTLTAGA